MYGSSWGFVPGNQVVQSQVERKLPIQLSALIWSCKSLPMFADSASVVEVARSMTWAEYQLLSADEKKGLITITDRYTADVMFVNGVFIDTNNNR